MIDLVRERLLEMRHQEAVRILRQHPSSTTTAIDAMLAVLDEIPTGAVPATRAVVADGGGFAGKDHSSPENLDI